MSLRLKRLTIATVITKAFHFPSLLHIFNKSTHFIFPLLRRFLSKTIRFMDSLLFDREDYDDFFSSAFDQSVQPRFFSDPGESIFLVSFRWWKAAVCGGGVVDGMSAVRGVLYNAVLRLNGDAEDVLGGFGDSEILLGMNREGEAWISGEEGVSGGEGHLALVSEWMFFTALKWHYDKEDVESLVSREDCAHDLFSLQIRLSYVRETSQLAIKISRKDNGVGVFNKAYNILRSKSGVLRVWDFSGQTTQLFVNNRKLYMDSEQSNEEIPLELQVYGSSCTINDEERSEEDMIVEPMTDGPSSSSSLWMNGCVDKMNLFSGVQQSSGVCGGCYGTGALGLTGLYNLGNTCFLNSAIQCLVHTPKLVDYFLGNFRKDLNFENPLGMNGKLAIAFGDLLRRLWAPGATPVEPRMFKSTISSFAPQFGGYNQHDSQEFLSFLLDGLHEDLNRVKRKPYMQAKDENGRPDEEVADEYWQNHLSRNDSIIVDLCQALETACSLRDDEILLIAEIYNNSILQILDDPDDSIELIRDKDQLVAYRLSKDMDESPLIVFMHQQDAKSYHSFSSFEKFGIPLVARMSDFSKGSEIRKEFLKLINPFFLSDEEFLNDDASRKSAHKDEELEDMVSDKAAKSNHESENDLNADCDFEFYLESATAHSGRFKIQMDEPVPVSSREQPIKVLVFWPEKMIQEYDTSILSVLPVVYDPLLRSNWTQDSISLYRRVDAFLKEEPLGPDDMWYCPNCKEHRQASKKLDLWRLPEILVIHLKRFSYTTSLKNKLETFVDFPINDFDLSKYVIQKNNMACHRYMLYAVSNHFGGMGGGHYTAFAKHRLQKWYEFDDSHVFPVTEERIKTQAAYVLFYKRI
ncbi:Ubiquitin-specific protease [Handroanthus impetiginosus]|uniref:Ubiquitin carboxyl-terminal hydrolase n=1 Tax=Handroanthus impetiginosus TaxID=429701 RepID=A0A2G9H072_9LAMI|nr:Ubiquitin-specific protease [Handroanthus impetiginosus]